MLDFAFSVLDFAFCVLDLKSRIPNRNFFKSSRFFHLTFQLFLLDLTDFSIQQIVGLKASKYDLAIAKRLVWD